MEKMGRLRRLLSESSTFGIGIVVLVTILMAFFSYIYEPTGDEILGAFDSSLTYYLDDYSDELGERIVSLNQVGTLLKFIYLNWSGRLTGYTLNLLGYLLPKAGLAIITSLMYTSVCLLALRIVFSDCKSILSHSVYFLVLYSALFWTKPYVYFTLMWTMTSIYVSSLLLCLLYYNIGVLDSQREKSTGKWFAVQIVGVLAGVSHEVIALCLISTILTKWIIDVVYGEVRFKSVFQHVGLGIGYVIGFFSPGNFSRIGESHDVVTEDFLSRIINSLSSHIYILRSEDSWMTMVGASLAILACISLIYLLCKKKSVYGVRWIVKEIAPLAVGGMVSIIVWAIMPKVSDYGLDLWIVLVYLIIIKMIEEARKNWSFSDVLIQNLSGILLISFILVFYWNETVSYHSVYSERMDRIQSAVENGQTEVKVPLYPQQISSERFDVLYLNDQEQYDCDYYQRYYGIHVILEEDSNG